MSGARDPEWAVELRGLAKSFGEIRANVDIGLRVRRGSIHAVIGENGAGKSTAMKMLYGMYAPEQGEILVNGVARDWKNSAEAISAGIGMVHQHFMLAGPYTVLENIVLGVEPVSHFRLLPSFLTPIDFVAARRKLESLMRQYGLSVDLEARVEDLAVGIQQRIEILKVLYREAEILILDEPTAVLTPSEATELFSNLKRLTGEGKTILIITHKLKEVMAVSDHITVFRAGRVVGDLPTAGSSPEQLAELMVGRKVNLHGEAPPPPKFGDPALQLTDLRAGALGPLSLTVRSGEIVGIAGVEGNGQSELLQLLLHPDEYSRVGDASGSMRFFGEESLDGRWDAARIKELGVGVIPEDRHKEALLLSRPAGENFLLGLHRRAPFSRWGILSGSKLGSAASKAFEDHDVRPRSLEILAGGLSGGNQQKLVIAREFYFPPRLLIAAQPTRGVDVGAIELIHKRILNARSGGAAVLLVSSELDEILALSDRILVMYSGKFVAELKRSEATEQALGLYMGGAGGRQGAAV